MAIIDRPPMSPQVQDQSGPPSPNPAFGKGIAEAQSRQGQGQIENAVSTCEKILMGVQDDTFRPYVEQAIAKLKIGLAMVNQKGPQSQAGGQPPAPGQQGQMPVPQLPPQSGQMPG